MIEILGGICVYCGEDGTTCALSIGHVKPRTWNIRALRYDARVKKYFDEFFNDVKLQVECLACNTKEMHARRAAEKDLEEAPF